VEAAVKAAARPARRRMDIYTLMALVIAVVVAAIIIWIIVPRGPQM